MSVENTPHYQAYDYNPQEWGLPGETPLYVDENTFDTTIISAALLMLQIPDMNLDDAVTAINEPLSG